MLARGKNIAVTGAADTDTGLSIITAVNIYASAAATLSLRDGAANGPIVAQTILGAAGAWSLSFPNGIRTTSGTWFISNSAANLTGGVAGQ